MTEEKARVQKVLEILYEAENPMKPKEIGEIVNERATTIGKDLYDLKRRSLAVSEEGLWEITQEGKEYIESGGQPKPEPKPEPKPKPNEVAETIPSQADLFRAEGERLGVGGRKGDIKLDA